MADAGLDDLGDVEIAAPSDGEVLTYEGATSLWKNKTISAPLSAESFRRAGRYHTTPVGGVATTYALSASRLYAFAFLVPVEQTFDVIEINVYTAAAAVSARLGIYADDGSVYPGALVLDAGTVSVATTGVKTISISQTLPAGLYWVVAVSDGAPTLNGRSVYYEYAPLGMANLGFVACNAWYAEPVTGALPTSFPVAGSIGSIGTFVALRKA